MKTEYLIEAQSGKRIPVKKGQKISIIDLEGQQVVDFFAELSEDSQECLSTGVTIDCNGSLKLKVGDIIYSNRYRAMLEILEDDVGEHDLLHPCCRKEMYDFFYQNGEGHPNCFDNINAAMEEKRAIIQPVNFFMHSRIHPDGRVTVEKPQSKAGDRVVLLAKADLILGIAACSVSESLCNGGRCSPVQVLIE